MKGDSSSAKLRQRMTNGDSPVMAVDQRMTKGGTLARISHKFSEEQAG